MTPPAALDVLAAAAVALLNMHPNDPRSKLTRSIVAGAGGRVRAPMPSVAPNPSSNGDIMQPHSGTQQEPSDFLIISNLSPALQRMVRAEMEGRPATPNMMLPSPANPQVLQQQHPPFSPANPYAQQQPSPAPAFSLQEEPSRLFGVELDTMTNISVSALKRPVDSLSTMTTDQPPTKKMRRSGSIGETKSDKVDDGGDDDVSNNEKTGLDQLRLDDNGKANNTCHGEDCDSLATLLPRAPRNTPNDTEHQRNAPKDIESQLDSQLETVDSEQKRKAIAEFVSKKPSKAFDTEIEYNSRILECKTLGRMLTGRWREISAGGGVKWLRHPVYQFYMWLRIGPNGEETLWTCRDGIWKRNVHAGLFSHAALGVYRTLWEDKKYLQQNMGRLGDPRMNKRAFKSVLNFKVSVGRGDGQFDKCVDAFWKSSRREKIHKMYSAPKKKKAGRQELSPPPQQQQQQQQQQSAFHLESGAIAAGASASLFSSGAIASGASASLLSPGTIASGASLFSSGANYFAGPVHFHHYHGNPGNQPWTEQSGAHSVQGPPPPQNNPGTHPPSDMSGTHTV